MEPRRLAMRRIPKILLLAIAFFLAPMAEADGHNASDTRPYMIAQQGGPTLSEAVERVRRQYKGRIVSAETKMRGKQEVHVIKVLTDDGKVRTITIPGRIRGS